MNEIPDELELDEIKSIGIINYSSIKFNKAFGLKIVSKVLEARKIIKAYCLVDEITKPS